MSKVNEKKQSFFNTGLNSRCSYYFKLQLLGALFSIYRHGQDKLGSMRVRLAIEPSGGFGGGLMKD